MNKNYLNLPAVTGILMLLSYTGNAQVIASRLKATARYQFNGSVYAFTDSSAYHYAGNKGGDLNTPDLPFDVATAWKFDPAASIIGPSQRSNKLYNADNTLNNRVDLLWNKMIAAWDYYEASFYSYNPDKNLAGILNQSWNAAGGAWQNQLRNTYTYDAGGTQPASYTIEKWNNTSATWAGTDKFYYTYDAAGNTEVRLYQTWNTGTSSWDNIYKDSTEYTPVNKPYYNMYQTWDAASGTWMPLTNTVYTYSSANYLLQQRYQRWDIPTGGWMNNVNYLYTYSSGKVAQATVQLWNDSNVVWDNYTRTLNSYDGAGNQVNSLNQGWSRTAKNWDDNDQLTRTFDGAGMPLSQVSSFWNTTTHAWDSLVRHRYNHNTYKQLTADISDVWNMAGYWAPITTDQANYYYYEEYKPSAIGEVWNDKSAALAIFPVPAGDNYTISMDWGTPQTFTVTIYDMLGRVWQSWNEPACISYRSVNSAAVLPAGQYVVELKSTEANKAARRITVVH